MKKATFILFLLATLLFQSCDSRIEEGELSYKMTYPHADTNGMVGRILPQEMTVIFKGTKTKTEIARGKLLNMQIISDNVDQSIEMRLDFGDKNYYCVLTEADRTKLLDLQPEYEVALTGKEDSVSSLWAKEYTVKEKGSDKGHQNAWFTEALRPDEMYFYSSYVGTKGVPLIYEMEQYKLVMRVEAKEFREREVREEEFIRDPSLREVSFDQYYEEVQELFDLLIVEEETETAPPDSAVSTIETDSLEVATSPE